MPRNRIFSLTEMDEVLDSKSFELACEILIEANKIYNSVMGYRAEYDGYRVSYPEWEG